MKKIVIWYSVNNMGDGSVYPAYFMTMARSQRHQEEMELTWGETCIGNLETFEGSDVHLRATFNETCDEDEIVSG